MSTESNFRLSIGGAESNVAIGLSRLGVATTWLGRVGSDGLGDRIARELRAESVTTMAIVDSEAATGLMIKERRTGDATRVTYHRSRSAGSRLNRGDVAQAGIANAAVLHLSGISLALSSSAADAVAAAVEEASAAAVPVSFDVNHRASLWNEHCAGPAYRDLASRATIVFAGIDEARLLVPNAEPTPTSLAKAIAELGPSQVLIKLGAEGCIAFVDGVEYVQAAIRVKAIDTVGAGDAFAAGYLAEFTRDLDIPERLVTAVTMGAFACLNDGDWEGYPRRDELGLLTKIEPVTR
jgi:2-dehydro-3-deoxygluconokinase